MKHWVFDLDGTLVDSFSHFFGRLTEIFESRGSRFTNNLRHAALTESLPKFFEHHLGKGAVESSLSTLQTQSNLDATQIRIFEGLATSLVQIKKKGGRIAVWTNRDPISAELIIEHSMLKPSIELCVSGTCTTERKPHPEGLLKIANHFQCAPHEITMVGDHEFDVSAAKKVGARAVRASWHSYWPVDRCPHSDHQFYSIQEFNQWVEGK